MNRSIFQCFLSFPLTAFLACGSGVATSGSDRGIPSTLPNSAESAPGAPPAEETARDPAIAPVPPSMTDPASYAPPVAGVNYAALFAAKLLEKAPSYEVCFVQTPDGPSLWPALDAVAQKGFVITALTSLLIRERYYDPFYTWSPTYPWRYAWRFVGYTAVGMRAVGATQPYEVATVQVVSEELEAAAQDMAANGYVGTALHHNEGGYALVGMRPKGQGLHVSAAARVGTGDEISRQANELGAQGFAIMGLAVNKFGKYAVVGFRPEGVAASAFEIRFAQAYGSQFLADASKLAGEGFRITGMAYSAGYTAIAIRETGAALQPVTVAVRQGEGDAIGPLARDLADQGFLITGANWSDSVGFTLVSVKSSP